MLKISVVIPTYNRKQELCKLLTQLNHQIFSGFQIQVFVVVDGSTDGTVEILKSDFPFVRIVQGPGNWWYTKSMNEGFKIALQNKPQYILCLNDDLEIQADYIEHLVHAINEIKCDSIIGSISYTIEKPYRIISAGVQEINPFYNRAIHYLPFLKIIDPSELSGVKVTCLLPGRGMLIPTNILTRLHLFDEKFVQYHSDTDFCQRALKNNVKIFISWDARVFCHLTKTSPTSSFLNSSFTNLIRSFFNPHSKRYIIDIIRLLIRHNKIIFVPVHILVFLISSFRNFYTKRKYNG